MNTVKALRDAGYRVKLRHVREFVGVFKLGDDEFMTRGEYEQARLNGEIEYYPWGAEYFHETTGALKVPSYGMAVDNFGGWTEVDITSPDGTIMHGKYSFRNKQFNRKIGTSAAIGIAMVRPGRVKKDKVEQEIPETQKQELLDIFN